MTKKQLIKKASDDFAKKRKMILKAPDDLDIYTVGTDHIAYQGTYEEMMAVLHRLRSECGNYELDYYRENTGTLSIRYKFEEFDVVLYCTDLESALDTISKGKCKLEKSLYASVEVVCAIK